MIVLIDYGMGNLGSVHNMLRKVGAEATITGDAAQIARADKLILPGVGAFDAAMSAIRARGLDQVLDRKARVDKVPLLGICLGMQLLTESSEEGSLPGLGWVPGTTLAFPRNTGLKVPHMGWNLARTARPNPLTESLGDEPRFYFVHSYYVTCTRPADAILTTTYGVEFVSALNHENIYGAQFHPEKSHRFGMRLFENFVRL